MKVKGSHPESTIKSEGGMLYDQAPLRELIKTLCWDMGRELSPLSLQRNSVNVILLKGFKYRIGFAAPIRVNTVVKLGFRRWESQQCEQYSLYYYIKVSTNFKTKTFYFTNQK